MAQRVESRIAALLARGQVRTPAQEAQARRFFAEAFQREAGIAAPRIFTNQERADWVEAYREAEPEARPALILAARSGAARSGAAPEGESAPPDEAALAELIAGLPADLRAEAEARAATIAELEEAGIDPASVDLTQADPDNLYGLRDPRLAPGPGPNPARALQLAQAGSDDAGGLGEGEARQPPNEREIAAFLAETAELSEEAFREAAAGLGLDPEMAVLFRDFLAVTPDTAESVKQRVLGLRNPDQFDLRRLLDGFEDLSDPEQRLDLLTPHLKLAQVDRPPFLGLGRPGRHPPSGLKGQGQRLGIASDGEPGPGRPRRQDDGPGSKPKDATNPRTRLPRANGRWEGEPGNGDWFSSHPEVNKVTKGKPIRYIDGRPDFSPWAAREPIVFEPGVLDGSRADFGKIYARLAKELGLKSRVEAKNYLRENELTPHHQDNRTILLVPHALNKHVPHVGSASDMRMRGQSKSRGKDDATGKAR